MDVYKMSPKQYISLQGGLGVLPQRNFGFRGHNLCILVPFWVIVILIRFTLI